MQADYRKAVEQSLAKTVKGIRATHTTEVVVGHPNQQLESLSKAVDLLVVGSWGWGAVRRVVIGSTGDFLAHHAHCPLVVVPVPDEAHTERRGAEAAQA